MGGNGEEYSGDGWKSIKRTRKEKLKSYPSSPAEDSKEARKPAYHRSRAIPVPALYVCHMARHNNGRILPITHSFTKYTGHLLFISIFRLTESFDSFQYPHDIVGIAHKRTKLPAAIVLYFYHPQSLQSSPHKVYLRVASAVVAGKIKKILVLYSILLSR